MGLDQINDIAPNDQFGQNDNKFDDKSTIEITRDHEKHLARQDIIDRRQARKYRDKIIKYLKISLVVYLVFLLTITAFQGFRLFEFYLDVKIFIALVIVCGANIFWLVSIVVKYYFSINNGSLPKIPKIKQ